MAFKTIILKGDGVHKEGIAAAAITPGHLIYRNTSNLLAVHATAAGACNKAFAREREITGDGIATAYAANDTVMFSVMQPGSEVMALIDAGVTTTIGAALVSAGDGSLKVRTDTQTVTITDPGNATVVAEPFVIGYALEAINNSGGSDHVRCMIEVA